MKKEQNSEELLPFQFFIENPHSKLNSSPSKMLYRAEEIKYNDHERKHEQEKITIATEDECIEKINKNKGRKSGKSNKIKS